jgi:indolepyruvate ferredoxin oxidoreductase
LTDPALKRELAQSFEPGAKLAFNLAPPVLGGKPINGRPPKRAFNARWMHPMMRLLAHGKVLRGTWLDPFGRTAERRTERALIAEYESLVNYVLDRLQEHNHPVAVTLLGLAGSIRGFGPVKEKAVAQYRGALAVAADRFEAEPFDVAA